MTQSTAPRATNRFINSSLALLAGMILTTLPAGAATFHVLVNGKDLTVAQTPIERGGRVFVPLRSIFESLGAGVAYDNGTINATAGDKTVQVKIGSNQAIVNGQQTFLEAAPYIVRSTTMVPLRFVSESLGAVVDYDKTSGAINIAAAIPPIANGSGISAVLGNDLNTKSATAGQQITMAVRSPYPNGGGVLAGATVYGHVLDVRAAGQGRSPTLELAVDTIKLAGSDKQYAIAAKIVAIDAKPKSNTTNEAAATLGGMLIGNWIGKSVGSNKGGLVGAAGGYLLSSNAKTNLDVPAGSTVALQLTDALVLK